MILAIPTYIVLTGVIALFVSMLANPELSTLWKQVAKRWTTYLIIGVFVLIWLQVAQNPNILI